MKSPKNTTLYSRLTLITSVTLVVGYFVVYAAWTNLDLAQVQSGEKITSVLMQNILNKINDIGTRTDGIYSSAGNIGIGTASPHAKIEISSTAPQFHINDIDGTAGSNSVGYIAFTHGTSGTVHGSIQQENGLMTLDSNGGNFSFWNGNVGIGTASPGANLDIYSATPHLRISDSTDKDTWAFGDIFSSIDFYSNDSYDAGPRVGAYIRAEHLRAGTGHVAADIGLSFGISGANSSPAYQTPYTAMVISNAGNVGIGITAPAQKLDVVGNIKTSGCLYYASSSLGTCASDERLKKDITPFTLGLDTILGLQPKHFKYNGLGGLQDDGIEQIGVIAQDVEKIAPSLIKKQRVQLHPNDQKQTEIKAVDYGSFTYLLINAVKELSHKLDSLFTKYLDQQDEIDELKKENDILKTQIKLISERLNNMENK